METAVIDASVLAAYLLREEGAERFEEFLASGVASIELALKEACSAAVKAVKRGKLSPEQAGRVVEAAVILAQSNVKTYPQRELIRGAAELATVEEITVYDALYVTLAKKLRIPLITLDEKVDEVARKAGVSVIRR